jgi:hypothetical protein
MVVILERLSEFLAHEYRYEPIEFEIAKFFDEIACGIRDFAIADTIPAIKPAIGDKLDVFFGHSFLLFYDNGREDRAPTILSLSILD